MTIYNEIRHHINSGTISKLPKDKLIEYSTALARGNAYTYFGSNEYKQACDLVRSLMTQYVTANKASKKSTEKIPPKKKRLYEIAVGVVTFVLGIITIWVINHYLNLDLK